MSFLNIFAYKFVPPLSVSGDAHSFCGELVVSKSAISEAAVSRPQSRRPTSRTETYDDPDQTLHEQICSVLRFNVCILCRCNNFNEH